MVTELTPRLQEIPSDMRASVIQMSGGFAEAITLVKTAIANRVARERSEKGWILSAMFAISVLLFTYYPVLSEPLQGTVTIERNAPAEDQMPTTNDIKDEPLPDVADMRRILKEQAYSHSAQQLEQNKGPDKSKPRQLETSDMRRMLKEQSERQALQLETSTTDEVPKPPAWIKEHVYTDEKAICYYGISLLPLPFVGSLVTLPAHLSESGVTQLHMESSLLAYWKGYKPRWCMVSMCHFGPPGNFRFWHNNPIGPRGYLVYESKTKLGYEKYRYWFLSDPDFETGPGSLDPYGERAWSEHIRRQQEASERAFQIQHGGQGQYGARWYEQQQQLLEGQWTPR